MKRILPLLAFAPVALALGTATPLLATAAGAGIVTVGPAALAGSAQVSPGDRISAGYDIAFAGGHPLATVHVSGATAMLALSCKQNASPAGQLVVPLADGSYTVASGDVAWHATASQRDHAGYQGAALVPDICGGRKMWVDTHGSLGVSYSAALDSADTHDAIGVRFHAIDTATDCAVATQNPSPGVSACDAAWSVAASTTAAPTPGTSGTGSGTGAPAPSPTPPASGSTAPATSPAAPGTNPPPASTRTSHGTAPKHSSAVAAVATHTASAGSTTALAAPAARPELTSGDVPLPVVVAPAGGSRRAVASASSPLPVARLASVLGELPVPALAAIAGGDLLLAIALIVRRRTRQTPHMNGGLSDVQVE